VVSRANTLAEWRGWSPFVGLQIPYNLLRRDVERELLPMAEAFGLSVAAWGPLAAGILSGKFTRPGGAEVGTRVSPDNIGEHEHTVASAVQEVAAEIGATASQVAIAWTMARWRSVHPIIGARRLDQLVDNLGAVDCVLPDAAVTRLEASTGFVGGFPGDFIAETASWVYGDAGRSVEGRHQRHAR
jgi:aryl-alcohol dehydrogenase-like predicted oxidoreductase